MKIPFDYDNATEDERRVFQKWLWEHPEYDDLDEEEQWYEDHLDEFVPAPKWVGESLREAAKQPPVIHRDDPKKPVSMRLGQTDLERLKAIARAQGLQYQSLIGSILHRYVTGTLVDVTEVKKVLSIK